MEKYEWIIGIGGSETDGVKMYKFKGTEEEAKKLLVKLATDDAINNEEYYEYGTENIDDVEVRYNGNLYAYGCYSDYHIDYEATRYDKLVLLEGVF